MATETVSMATSRGATERAVALEERYGARIYQPLDVVLERGEGCWVFDVEGRRYLDCLSAYSAANFGHTNPALVAAASEQLGKLALTSRAFRNAELPGFLRSLCTTFGFDMALPMNTGVEAVETAIKAARKWAYEVKGVAPDEAEIIVCGNNFHGRTIAVVGFSSEPAYRRNFGPFAPGFRTIPFGDVDALRAAITERTAAFLAEPIQGEAGVIVPPDGYLSEAAAACREQRVLFIADEIQTGLGRTGALLACDHEGVRPDVAVIGKSLGGGLYPVSAVLASREVLGLFGPGDHGSTFAGNPLAAAIGRAVLRLLEDGELLAGVRDRGRWLAAELAGLASPIVREVRGRGLMIGIALTTPARATCERLARAGVLCKETHGTVLRLTPPLTLDEQTGEWLLCRLASVLRAS
jgi:ornithine--oxo-acid transaminase